MSCITYFVVKYTVCSRFSSGHWVLTTQNQLAAPTGYSLFLQALLCLLFFSNPILVQDRLLKHKNRGVNTYALHACTFAAKLTFFRRMRAQDHFIGATVFASFLPGCLGTRSSRSLQSVFRGRALLTSCSCCFSCYHSFILISPRNLITQPIAFSLFSLFSFLFF